MFLTIARLELASQFRRQSTTYLFFVGLVPARRSSGWRPTRFNRRWHRRRLPQRTGDHRPDHDGGIDDRRPGHHDRGRRCRDPPRYQATKRTSSSSPPASRDSATSAAASRARSSPCSRSTRPCLSARSSARSCPGSIATRCKRSTSRATRPFVLLVLPNVVFVSALMFAVGALTRNLFAIYTQGILLLAGYLAYRAESFLVSLDQFTARRHGRPVWRHTVWPAHPILDHRLERNTRSFTLSGPLLTNRLIWLGVAVALVAVTFRCSPPGSRPLHGRSAGAVDARLPHPRRAPRSRLYPTISLVVLACRPDSASLAAGQSHGSSSSPSCATR